MSFCLRQKGKSLQEEKQLLVICFKPISCLIYWRSPLTTSREAILRPPDHTSLFVYFSLGASVPIKEKKKSSQSYSRDDS